MPSGRTRWIPNNKENRHAKNAHSLPTSVSGCTMQHSVQFYYPGYHIGNKAGLIARRGDGTVKSSARQPLPSPSFLAFPCMQQPLFPPFPRATPPPIRKSSFPSSCSLQPFTPVDSTSDNHPITTERTPTSNINADIHTSAVSSITEFGSELIWELHTHFSTTFLFLRHFPFCCQ